MRRIAAVAAALALTATLVGSVAAAPRSSFVGSFDVLVDGVVGFSISANLASNGTNALAGTYSSRSANGVYHSTAQCGEAAFYIVPGEKGVWFKCLEIGFPGSPHPGYTIFQGHFVDNAAGGRWVEFYDKFILGDVAGETYLDPAGYGEAHHFGPFQVGKGSFALNVNP